MISYVPLFAQGAGGQYGIAIGGNPLILFVAITAALGGVGLYFIRNWRPELSRDHDIFLSAIALVYGMVLLFFSFKMDQVTQFAQFLLVCFGGWFAFETLSLRQIVSTQARRAAINQPIVEDDPPDFDYRNDLDPSREIPTRRSPRQQPRQMRPYRPSELTGDVEVEQPPRRSSRRSPNTSNKRNNLPNTDIPIIDVEDDDIKPVAPRPRRNRPQNPEPPSDFTDQSRRRSGRRSSSNADYPEPDQDIDASEREDY